MRKFALSLLLGAAETLSYSPSQCRLRFSFLSSFPNDIGFPGLGEMEISPFTPDRPHQRLTWGFPKYVELLSLKKTCHNSSELSRCVISFVIMTNIPQGKHGNGRGYSSQILCLSREYLCVPTSSSANPLLPHSCVPFSSSLGIHAALLQKGSRAATLSLPPSFPSGSILSSPSLPSLFPSLPPPNFSHFEVPLRMWLNFESGTDTFKKRHCLPFSPMCHVVMKIHVN